MIILHPAAIQRAPQTSDPARSVVKPAAARVMPAITIILFDGIIRQSPPTMISTTGQAALITISSVLRFPCSPSTTETTVPIVPIRTKMMPQNLSLDLIAVPDTSFTRLSPRSLRRRWLRLRSSASCCSFVSFGGSVIYFASGEGCVVPFISSSSKASLK